MEMFKVGDIIEVTINNILSFGVFCKCACANNYTGLIHISNISNSFINNVEDYFSIGEVIKVEIISIDNDNKKLSLSTKKFEYRQKIRRTNNMNKVILIGRLARDLKLYKTQSEKPFTFFTIAVNNISNQADFISCVAWNKVAEEMCEYLGKGSLISISGILSVRKIINQDRKEQYITEVVAENVTFLDYRKQENNLNNANIENAALATDKKIDLDSAFKNINYTLNNSGIENLYENNNLDFTEEVIVWDN